MSRVVAVLTAVVVVALGAVPAGAADSPVPTQNPFVAADGFAMMHGDTASSDTTPAAGPGPGPVTATDIPLTAACPSVEVGTDDLPVATCTLIATRQPTLFLLDPATGLPVASHSLTAGSSVLGGVYDYLDQANRVVIVDGSNDLQRIGHTATAFTVDSTVALGPAVTAECGSATCDTVVGLTPDDAGRVWFATQAGLVGTVDAAGTVRTVHLPTGEQIGNSISSQDGWVAIVTTQALYLFDAAASGAPEELTRVAYENQGARKPGQLTDGSGTTPVFFGPHHASDYVAIVDNARPHEDLDVFAMPASHTAPVTLRPVCSVPVLTRYAASGTEDAPIGFDRSVVVNNTYGYSYPAGTTGTSDPASATFEGGMTRVDVDPSGSGCSTVWDSPARSSALPRLSTSDGLIHTVVATPLTADETNVYGDSYSYAAISEATGQVVSSTPLGTGPTYDVLQLVGTTTRTGVLFQGTLTGLLRVAPTTAIVVSPSAGAGPAPSATASAVAGTPAAQAVPASARGSLAVTGLPLVPEGLVALTLLVAGGAVAVARRRAG